MGVMNIVIVVFILLIVIYLLVNAFSKTSKLTKMADGKLLQTIPAKDLKNSNNSSNYTYSMWLFIDDWNYRFGDKKIVLQRANSPRVVLGTKPNTLAVKVKYFDSGSTGSVVPYSPDLSNHAANVANRDACNACNQGFKCACANCDPLLFAASEAAKPGSYSTQEAGAPKDAVTSLTGAVSRADTDEKNIHTCEIDNIPIQKWVNVIVSLYGRTLDIYLDGKLVRTCVIPGVPKVDNNAAITVTPAGGFSGWTSTFKYWSNASNPQEAYNIYKDGFGGSILANALNKYKIRLSLMKGQKVASSFEI